MLSGKGEGVRSGPPAPTANTSPRRKIKPFPRCKMTKRSYRVDVITSPGLSDSLSMHRVNVHNGKLKLATPTGDEFTLSKLDISVSSVLISPEYGRDRAKVRLYGAIHGKSGNVPGYFVVAGVSAWRLKERLEGQLRKTPLSHGQSLFISVTLEPDTVETPAHGTQSVTIAVWDQETVKVVDNDTQHNTASRVAVEDSHRMNKSRGAR